MEPKLFIATKAFIVHNGKVLILRESPKYGAGTNIGRYDVVGGRLNPGEKWDDGLLREIKEETGLSVKIGKPFAVNEWRPVVKGEQWHVVGVFIECHAEAPSVVMDTEHDHYEWIEPKDYQKYNLIPNLHSMFEAYLKK
jgi:8-oxo-dGTP diphosphatase